MLTWLTLALAADPLPLECPGAQRWGTIVAIQHDTPPTRHDATDGVDPLEAGGYPMVEVHRGSMHAPVVWLGRVGAALCAGDRLEAWHGVRVSVSLEATRAITRLPDGAHLLLQSGETEVWPYVLDGVQEWYVPAKALSWRAFSAAGGTAAGSNSTFRVEVDAVRVDARGEPHTCHPPMRVAVLATEPGDAHYVKIEHGGRVHTVAGGHAMEFRAGHRPRELPPDEAARMLGALQASAQELQDTLARVEGTSEPVGYPTLPLRLEDADGQPAYNLEVGQLELSHAQWAEIMGAPHQPPPGCVPPTPAPGLPVTCVTWGDAAELANRLSRRNGYAPVYHPTADGGWAWDPSADGYRLPTWAEWRQLLRRDPAHRGAGPGPCTANLTGQEAGQPDALACSDPWAGPSPVGEVFANGDRVRGLIGNVAELLSCPQDQVCLAAGGSWRTGQAELAGLLLAPERLRPDEALPHVGVRLVRQVGGR